MLCGLLVPAIAEQWRECFFARGLLEGVHNRGRWTTDEVLQVGALRVECTLFDNWVCSSETSCEFGRNTGIEQRLLVFRDGEVDVLYFRAEHLADLGGDFWVGQG